MKRAPYRRGLKVLRGIELSFYTPGEGKLGRVGPVRGNPMTTEPSNTLLGRYW